MAADIASSLDDWSTTEASNLPAGTTAISTNLDDNLRMLQAVVRAQYAEGTIASASTTDLASVETAMVNVTGTTTITALGTLTAGMQRILIFAGALTLTHNATSLILPTGANITTAAGDVAWMISEGSGNWRCLAYTRATGYPLLSSGLLTDGSAAAPALNFASDTNTGLYRIGADSIGLTLGGTLRCTWATTGLTSTVLLSLPTGTEGAPSLNFGDANSGIYGGSDSVSMAAGGATSFRATSTLTTSFVPMYLSTGVEIDGKFSFGNDPSDVPTISAGGGTGGTIAGNDHAFTVTAGTGSPTSVTVDFGTAFANAPVCVATSSQSGLVLHVASTTTAVQISANAAISSGTKIHCIALGYT